MDGFRAVDNTVQYGRYVHEWPLGTINKHHLTVRIGIFRSSSQRLGNVMVETIVELDIYNIMYKEKKP